MQKDSSISIPSQYLNNYDDFDGLSLSKIEKKVYMDLNNSSLETGNEAIQVFYENGNTEIIISSEYDKVFIPKEVFDKTGCITINGDIFEIEVVNGYRPEEFNEFDNRISEIYNEVGKEIVMNPCQEMTGPENSYYLIRETMYRVSRYYCWTIRGGNIHE